MMAAPVGVIGVLQPGLRMIWGRMVAAGEADPETEWDCTIDLHTGQVMFAIKTASGRWASQPVLHLQNGRPADSWDVHQMSEKIRRFVFNVAPSLARRTEEKLLRQERARRIRVAMGRRPKKQEKRK